MGKEAGFRMKGTQGNIRHVIVRCEREVSGAMRAHAVRARPREACGLLGGLRSTSGFAVVAYLPLANRASGMSRFAIDPLDFAAAEHDLRRAGSRVVGVFHSHPEGPAEPSDADLSAAWPEHCQLIGGIADSGEFEIAAFYPRTGTLRRAELIW